MYSVRGEFKMRPLLFALSFLLPATLFSQPERWVFLHDGGDSLGWERANKITLDEAGNIYAVGYITTNESGYYYNHLVVLSLTANGTLRWTYTYDGSQNWHDKGYDIAYEQGNLYVTGVSADTWLETIFTMSIDTNGNVNWINLFPLDPGIGKSIAVGAGFVFVGAEVNPGNQGSYFPALIIYHTDGTYIGATYYTDGFIYSNTDWHKVNISYSTTDGNIYMASNPGHVPTQTHDFTIMSYQPNGDVNFSYYYDSGDYDEAKSVVLGDDGNVYAVGTIGYLFSVLSLTSTGTLRWLYQDPQGGSGGDILFGDNGLIYAVGSTNNSNLEILCLDTLGSLIWKDTTSLYVESGMDIIVGEDGNLYELGKDWGRSASHTKSGTRRFLYGGPSNVTDIETYSMIYGHDGNLYACGTADDYDGTSADFFVFSFNPSLRIDEDPQNFNNLNNICATMTMGSQLKLEIKSEMSLGFDVYSVNGSRLIHHPNELLHPGAYTFDLFRLGRGVYLIQMNILNHKENVKFIRF